MLIEDEIIAILKEEPVCEWDAVSGKLCRRLLGEVVRLRKELQDTILAPDMARPPRGHATIIPTSHESDDSAG